MTAKQAAFSEMKATGINPIPEEKRGLRALYMNFQEMCTISFQLDLLKIQHQFSEFPSYRAKIILPNGQELMFLKYLTKTKNVYKYFVNRSQKNKFSDALFVGIYNSKSDKFNISAAFIGAINEYENPCLSMQSALSFVKEVEQTRRRELQEIVEEGVTATVGTPIIQQYSKVKLPRKRL